MFDLDASGKISRDELKEVLGKNELYKDNNNAFWDSLIREADKDGDGEIDYTELKDFILFVNMDNSDNFLFKK